MTLIRFDVRPDQGGWTIYDRQSGEPASLEWCDSFVLDRENAEKIADLMNALALMREQGTVH
jgi:hypothetical protein